MTAADRVDDVFGALCELERAMAVAAASEARETPLGTLVRAPGLPDAHDANALIAGAAAGAAGAEALAGVLDELQGDLRHRKAWVYDDAAGAALSAGMRQRGYACEREVVLALRGAAPGVEGPAREVARGELREVERIGMREDGLPEDPIEQLVELRDRTAEGMGARFFVAEDAAHATLYRLGPVASVTDVGTHAAHRNRGLARSVIALATHAALADGARHVVLVTDADDWMAGFYRRLGFTAEVGAYWVFLRTLD